MVSREYIEAARLTGASRIRIARSQVLPNVLNDIIVYSSGLVGVAMITAASLSFLGLGSPRRRRRNGATCSTACAARSTSNRWWP